MVRRDAGGWAPDFLNYLIPTEHQVSVRCETLPDRVLCIDWPDDDKSKGFFTKAPVRVENAHRSNIMFF